MRPSDLVLAAAVIGGAIWTYSIKHDAEAAADRVAALRKQIAAEEERIVFLRADWAYLNAPARLERLVVHFADELELGPVEAHQWVQPFELPVANLPDAELSAEGAAQDVTGSVTLPKPRPRAASRASVEPSRPRRAAIPVSIDDLLKDR